MNNSYLRELEKLASQGNENAMWELNFAYFAGGVENPKISEKIKWLEFGAKNGDLDSLYTLSIMYGQGIDVESNHQKSVEYIKKASELGDSECTLILGLSYDNGFGVKKDIQLAEKYYMDSIYPGYRNIFHENGLNLKYGEGYELYEKKQFISLLNKAEKGDKTSMYYIGNMYITGNGVETDQKSGIELLEKLGSWNNGESYRHLGSYYKQGEYLEQDYKKAYKYYNMAAKNGSFYAIITLINSYIHENELEVTYEEVNMMIKQNPSNFKFLSKASKSKHNSEGIDNFNH